MHCSSPHGAAELWTMQSAHADPCPPAKAPAEQWKKVAWSDKLCFLLQWKWNSWYQEALWEEGSAEESVLCFGRWSAGVLPSMWMRLWHIPSMYTLLQIMPTLKWKYFLQFVPFQQDNAPCVWGVFWGNLAFKFLRSYKSNSIEGRPHDL